MSHDVDGDAAMVPSLQIGLRLQAMRVVDSNFQPVKPLESEVTGGNSGLVAPGGPGES